MIAAKNTMRQLPYESSIDAVVALGLNDQRERQRLIAEREKEFAAKRALQTAGMTIEKVLADVCEVFEIPEEKLLAKNRQVIFVEPRRIFIWVAFKKIGCPKIHISRFLNQDHTTILYQLKTVQIFLKQQNPEFVANWKYYLHNSKLFTENDFQ